MLFGAEDTVLALRRVLLATVVARTVYFFCHALLDLCPNTFTSQVFAIGAEEATDEDSDDVTVTGTPGAMGRGRGGGRIREASVGAQFKQSLAGLIGTISTTQPR